MKLRTVRVFIIVFAFVLAACEANIFLPAGSTCQMLVNGETHIIDAISVKVDNSKVPTEFIFKKGSKYLVRITSKELKSGTSGIQNLSDFKTCLDETSDGWVVSGANKEDVLNGLAGIFRDIPQQIMPATVNNGVTPGNVQNNVPSVPTSVTTEEYWFRSNNGTEKRLLDLTEAQKGFEAGIVYLKKLVDGNVVSETPIAPVEQFDPPKGPNGLPIQMADAQTPYFVNQGTGVAYSSQDEAIADAKKSTEQGDIHQFVRGQDNGIVITIPAFNVQVQTSEGAPIVADPAEEYLQVEGGNAFTLDNFEEALRQVCATENGGNVYVAKRGENVRLYQNVPEWHPDPQIASVLGGDFCAIYWEFVAADGSGNKMYSATKEEAVAKAEAYGANGVFPGGMIVPNKRGQPQPVPADLSKDLRVPSWSCPTDQPNCQPNISYFTLNGVTYTSKEEAVSAAGLDWWFDKDIQITEELRHRDLNTYVSRFPFGHVLAILVSIFLLLYGVILWRLKTFRLLIKLLVQAILAGAVSLWVVYAFKQYTIHRNILPFVVSIFIASFLITSGYVYMTSKSKSTKTQIKEKS